MQELLRQMHHSTALMLERMGQFQSPAQHSSPAPERSCISSVPTVVQPCNTVSPTTTSQMPSAPRTHNLPVPSYRTISAPNSHFQPAPTFHFQTVPPRHTVYQPRPDYVQPHLSRLFRSQQGASTSGVRKRKRETPWTHAFICLPEVQSSVMPTIEEARYYSACGLGQKTVWFPHNEGDHAFFSEHLLSAFPPLRDAGGFVLARGSRGRVLEELPIPPEGYSLSYVRSACTRAPLYVVPLQQSLPLRPPPADEVSFYLFRNLHVCFMLYGHSNYYYAFAMCVDPKSDGKVSHLPVFSTTV